MAGKKSQEIKTLLRVQSWSVDEQRRILNALLDREQALIADGERMDQQLLQEQQVASTDPTMAGHAYVAYAKAHRVRRDNVDTVLAALRVEIEQQRDMLAEAYKELKVLEQVRKNWLEAERKEEARIEQIDLDEIAQTLYRREKALETG
jgi:flagellar export protein FliJ